MTYIALPAGTPLPTPTPANETKGHTGM
jgi:hypothetical protein